MAVQTIAPSSNNRLMGRAHIFLRLLDTDANTAGPFFHVGNAPDFTVATDVQVLVNKSSMHSDSRTLDEIPLETTIRYRMSTQEFNQRNLAYALGGEEAFYTQTIQTTVSYTFPATETIVLGGYYKLPHRAITSITSVNDESSAGTHTSPTDWVLWDDDEGIIQIPTTSDLTVGDTLTVVYSAAAIAGTAQPIIRGGVNPLVRVGVMAVGDPAYGPKWSEYLWKGSIKPQDAIALIQGQQLGTLGFEITALDDSAGTFGGSTADPLHRFVPATA